TYERYSAPPIGPCQAFGRQTLHSIPNADSLASIRYCLTAANQRGLLDTTLLLIGGEFGRTPKVNKDAGRDHWPMVYTTVLCGGGVKQGVILGESDSLAEYPKSRPISHQDVLATI
ncbi:MAG: DUF1501 domain-containing protein, partial [Pirellulales bacterium]